jgi:hypothetical protein
VIQSVETKGGSREMARKVKINRAPVMTLWAAIVAERLGHNRETALTLGKAVARLNAESKGQRLGIIDEKTEAEAEEARKKEAAGDPKFVKLLGRSVPIIRTPEGLRATLDGEAVDAAGVERYLKQRFKDELDAVRAAMEELAEAHTPEELERRAYDLYEAFRPAVPEGKKGWGAAGELDLDGIRSLAK